MTTLNQSFPTIKWINLDRRPDRRQHFETEMERVGFTAERVAAVDALTTPRPLVWNSQPLAYGCNLSHELVLRQHPEGALIFEDDAVFCPDFAERFPVFMQEVPDDWQLLYLGCNNTTPPIPVTPNVARVKQAFTTHAYAIRGQAISILLASPIFKTDVIDWVLREEVQPRVPTYCATPALVTQLAGFSDILQQHADYHGAIR